MRNVLVTGGAGFIGSNFVRCLLESELHVRIVNLDALTYAGSRENLRGLPDPERHTFVAGNICDRDLLDHLLNEYALDTIVHFAAESGRPPRFSSAVYRVELKAGDSRRGL